MTELSIKEAWKIWWDRMTPSCLLVVFGFTIVRFIVVTTLKICDDPKEWHY